MAETGASARELRVLYDAWQAETQVPGSACTDAYSALEDVIFESLPRLLDLTRHLGSACDAIVGALHLLDNRQIGERNTIIEIRQTMDRLYEQCPEALGA